MPPWLRHRPLRIALAMHGLPLRVLAPHLGPLRPAIDFYPSCPPVHEAYACVLVRGMFGMMRPRSFSLGIKKRSSANEVQGFMALPLTVAFIQAEPRRLVLPRDRARWEPQGRVTGPWGFALSSAGFGGGVNVGLRIICLVARELAAVHCADGYDA